MAWGESSLSVAGVMTEITWPGGEGLIDIFGTFGGDSVTLQRSAPGGTYHNVLDDTGTAISFTAAGPANVKGAAGDLFKFVRTGSAGGILTVLARAVAQRQVMDV